MEYTKRKKQTVVEIKVDELKTDPILFRLPADKQELTFEPTYEKLIPYPKFTLGFQHYLHQSKGKTAELEEKFGARKPYRIVNPFEHQIPDFDKSISDVALSYLKIKDDQPKTIDRAFYKIWEMLILFDLIPEKENIITAHLAEAPGGFVYATILFRENFLKSSKNDKFYVESIYSESKDVPTLDDSLLKYYSKKIINHRTYPLKEVDNVTDNGDLTHLKTINNFAKYFDKKSKASFITADGGFVWKDETNQEQEALKLIISEILTALKIQETGGNFVCKIFESFTLPTAELLFILTQVYDEVYLYKPYTSRSSNSEKYVICKGYKENKNITKELENLLTGYITKNETFLHKIFPENTLPANFLDALRNANTRVSNVQYIMLNEIMKYTAANNYFGAIYRKYRERQISAAIWWMDNFYPKDEKDLKKTRKKIFKQEG